MNPMRSHGIANEDSNQSLIWHRASYPESERKPRSRIFGKRKPITPRGLRRPVEPALFIRNCDSPKATVLSSVAIAASYFLMPSGYKGNGGRRLS